MNKKIVNTLSKGWSYDLDDNIEDSNSYFEGLNGRLYYKNGILSFNSIKGTIEVNNTSGIIKYLGLTDFIDEVIAIVKFDTTELPTSSDLISTEYREIDQTKDYAWAISGSTAADGLNLTAGLETYTVAYSEEDDNTPAEYLDKSNEAGDDNNTHFDPRYFFSLSKKTIVNYKECTYQQADVIPEYNKTYSDAILSFTIDENNDLQIEVIWLGYLNLDINRKIDMIGHNENINYRRVYFSDYLNPLRNFNRKNPQLLYKRSYSFDIEQDVLLVQPVITGTENNGILKAMTVQYTFRCITEFGQMTTFSHLSEMYPVLVEDEKSTYRGGDVKENTGKSVNIMCLIPEHEKYTIIEAIAVEYETADTPSSIVSLGHAASKAIVEFKHTGNESIFSNDLTLSDIIVKNQHWKYASGLTIHRNKMIAAGLRNDPYPVNIKYLEDLFLLKGYASDGTTHSSLINPTPNTYKYTDPLNTDAILVTAKRQYTQFYIFGNTTLVLTNTDTSVSIEHTFTTDKEVYVDIMQEVYDWLNTADLTDFPNLEVIMTGGTLAFQRIVPATLTDLFNYQFSSKNNQLIVNFDNQYEIDSTTIATTNLVFGATSYGFNKGDGIRLSWYQSWHELMSKSDHKYDGNHVLQLNTPIDIKGFMKNEIYRLAITLFKNGYPLFSIPLGDIQAPAIGDEISAIKNDGTVEKLTEVYSNQKVEGELLYGSILRLKAEVRLNCEMNKFVDSWQIQYVERSGDNKTILAQGIASPMQRWTKFQNAEIASETKAPIVFRKWTLPYMGGPLTERNALDSYDNNGVNYEETEENTVDAYLNRIIANRKMFWFDSPDILYDKTSMTNANAAKAHVIGRLHTDHPTALLSDFNITKTANNWDPFEDIQQRRFSRCIYEGGQSDFYEKYLTDDLKEHHPYYINISVFSELIPKDFSRNIDVQSVVGDGRLLPGNMFDLSNDISNNAMTLGDPQMYYSSLLRKGGDRKVDIDNWFDNERTAICGFMKTINVATGYRTNIIKTDEDLFTDADFYNDLEYMYANCDYFSGNSYGLKQITDAHALINIELNNHDTVYGGRNKFIFSKNIYVPLSKVVPLYKNSNQGQITYCEGDTYTTLFLRQKTDYHRALEIEEFKMLNSEGSNWGDNTDKYKVEEYNRPNAWMYAVVLETMVQERQTHHDRFYRNEGSFDFTKEVQEYINKTYLNTNNIKSYIARPVEFKDNPILFNTIAASKIKLNGDIYDAFAYFPANDKYDIESNLGQISNVFVYKDNLYVIQKGGVTGITIDPKDIIRTEQGAEIQTILGTGTVFHSHKVLSNYGTSIRKNLLITDNAFMFIDEHKNEFIHNLKPLFEQHALHILLNDEWRNNRIKNIAWYYDDRYKEINTDLLFTDNSRYTISYNEIMKVFNGKREMSSDIYLKLKDRIFAPLSTDSSKLHELNEGAYLDLFNSQKYLTLSIIIKETNNSSRRTNASSVNASQILKLLTVNTNIDYKIKEVNVSDQRDIIKRIIGNEHYRYNINEGYHEIPLRNLNDRYDPRGKYFELQLIIESKNNSLVKLFNLISTIRLSQI